MRRAGSLVTLTTAGLMGLGYLGSPVSAAYGDNFVQTEATASHVVSEVANVMVVANASDTVDNGNLGEAYTHDCTGCRAVAVAFQVVLVPGSPHTVKPGNLASAATERCSHCVAIAFAKQILIYSHGATRIDEDAQAQVNRISAEVHDIATSGADGPTMSNQLTPLFDRLVATVNDGLVNSSDGRRSERTREA